jgi:hypothetical protein
MIVDPFPMYDFTVYMQDHFHMPDIFSRAKYFSRPFNYIFSVGWLTLIKCIDLNTFIDTSNNIRQNFLE